MTKRHSPSAPYTAIYAVAIAVFSIVVALFTRSLSSHWLQDPVSGEMRLKYVDKLQLSQSGEIKLLVMGSSRPSFGITANDLAKALNIPEVSTKNIAFPALGIYSMLSQLRTHETKLTNADIWIIGIDDYYLLTARAPSANTDQSIMHITENYVATPFSNLIYLNSKGRLFVQNAKAAVKWGPMYSFDVWTVGSSGAWHDEHLSKRVLDATADAHIFEAITTNYFANKRFDPAAAKAFEQILNIGRENNVKIVLVDMPYHPKYKEIVQERYNELATLNREAFRHLAKQYGANYVDCDREDCGVKKHHFGDPVHLNDEGAKKFTAFLAKRIL